MISFLKRVSAQHKQAAKPLLYFCTAGQQQQSQILGEYVIKSKMSGNSQENLYEKYRNFYNASMDKVNIPGTTIVKSRDQAHRAVKILKSLPLREHAWDTETVDVDAKLESPIGKGKIICASAFCGLDVDFGNGPRLFIDNFAQNTDLIQVFKEYLEDSRYKKIWHNYGFDRHIFNNHGIDVSGFGGDTMHMSRLADPSRGPKEYSLSAVTKHYEEEILDLKRSFLNDLRDRIKTNTQELQKILKAMQNDETIPQDIIDRYQLNRFDSKEAKINFITKEINKWQIKGKPADIYERYYLNANIKTNMKQLFGKKKYLKDGKEGKTIEFPNIIRMHTDPELIEKWVHYSCLDAEVTFFAFQVLKNELKGLKTNFEDMKDMLDLYNKYWLPFGEILTDLENRGFEVNLEHLDKIRVEAENDMIKLEKQFMDWVCSTQEGLEQLNCSSTQQLQQLFFAPFKRKKKAMKKEDNANLNEQDKKDLQGFKNFEESNNDDDDDDNYISKMQSNENSGEDDEEEDEDAPKKKGKRLFKKPKKDEDEDDGYHSDGRKKSVRKEEDDIPQTKAFKVLNLKGFIPEGKKKPPKQLDMFITGLGMDVIDVTESGMPAADLPVLKQLAGNPKKGNFGLIGEHYKKKGDEEMGKRASIAIESLIQLKSVETLLTTFIIPLRELATRDGRIHCSLNMNTETGRISARKPNLMNQPSHDKDVYKIRSAFQAGKGKKLIVADYGQLELRILAHMTNCKAMIDAFKMGGDFHSRTAMGMYPKLKEEIEKGELLLEWDRSQGEAPAPLLKDKYSGERKKAKMMNFSIAYGKSAHGFSKDWGCTYQEAQEALDAWFADRIEVKNWQENTKRIALDHGYTQTMMGRYRNLERYTNSKTARHMVQHGLRASINTPIQGGAADLVIAAMVKVSRDKKLEELGYKLLLQIHDELILEGPEEHAKEALARVIEIMEDPLDSPLSLKMEVDAKIGNNWYECK